ncbi:hypothetical protein D9611_004874 [Ephemerocybe angulata]|uniref:Pali-domain-containing protein n=1 Tax=Ephemerocybe angulata TaxID=980116 RepID=A0A8H5EXC9_9AGAR|nr:hypothetical protein D9611_004874 [Tulosesus angulatus]
MARIFCIPGIVFLFCALVLSFLASISLPYLPALDIVRVKFPTSALVADAITELRYGIWTVCSYGENESRTCLKTGYAYEMSVKSAASSQPVTIGKSWTRGLVVNPIATGVTLIALLLSLSQNMLVTLLASMASFLAGVLHLISFFIQIALFARIKDKMKSLDVEANTKPGPGFWLVFVSLILTFLAGCTVFFGRRRDQARTRGANLTSVTPSEKTGFFSRFRK